ncbi:hypothetical protein [Methanocalculus taiwanensis]|uniref:hypothetical protein n=1 Tax=Methanocalculus taiwanensis TaxID=106207 RepID=UPI00210094DE|nr:hypothetical protein [Methanocalculus taiwanensis]
MKNKNRFSGLSALSIAVIAVILSAIFIAGLSLAGGFYAMDKNAPAKSGDQLKADSVSIFQ